MRYIQHIGKYGICVIFCFFLLYPTDTQAKQEPLQLENQQDVRLKIVSKDEGGGEGKENEGGNDGGEEEIIPDGQGDSSLNESGKEELEVPEIDANLPNLELPNGKLPELNPIEDSGIIDPLEGYETADSAPLPQTGVYDSVLYTLAGIMILIGLLAWQIRTRMRKRYE
ncbi:LPXTG cell wall anchor domain-containing protein [Kurthia gibsonii]|uniref:LPXTG cell wall anchor domain-containing protein n=1 Tax=Kurthia gibsonii TaxID=33946 RepID=UPI002DBEBDB0|nr:LPXTG cell wall anchor domain-containing protein [Kurthia gibsonii]MEB7771152.1 LPXTG cell wall anchor domain-containing protein [Kurthia gibsonii]